MWLELVLVVLEVRGGEMTYFKCCHTEQGSPIPMFALCDQSNTHAHKHLHTIRNDKEERRQKKAEKDPDTRRICEKDESLGKQ